MMDYQDPFQDVPEPEEQDVTSLSETERDELGMELCRYIEAGIAQQGDLPQRWEQLEKDYANQPSGSGVELIPGQPPRHINLTQPRVDRLVGSVVEPICSQKPYYVASGYNQSEEALNEAEDTVHFLFKNARYETKLRIATRMACMAEPAIFRPIVRTQEDEDIDVSVELLNPKAILTIDVIHPKDFVIYPAAVQSITRAALTGHRFWLTKDDIQEMMDSDEFYPCDIAFQGEDPQSDEAGKRKDWSLTEETSGITEPGHQMIKCYEVIFKKKLGKDKKRKYYRAIIAFNQKYILKLEHFEYSRPWYFGHYLHEEYNAFYSANPLTQNLQQLQQCFNDLMNLCIDGGIFNAFPAGFTNNRVMGQEFVKYQPGTVYQVDGNPEIYWTKPQFDPGVIPALLEKFEQLADAAFRISQAGMGQEFKSGMTATEASGILQGQQAGLDEYRANASTSGAEMSDFIRELAFEHYENFVATFQSAFPCKNRDSLSSPLMWEANGKSSENLPQTVIAKLQGLLAFLEPLVPAIQQTGANVDVLELAKMYLGALKLPVDTSKIIKEPDVSQPGTAQPDVQNALMALSAQGMGNGPSGLPQPNLPPQPLG